MKSTSIISTISAAALLGISGVALAQGTGGGMAPGGSPGAPAGNTMQRMDAPSSGSTAPSTQNQPAPGGSGMSGDRMAPSQAQGNSGKGMEKSNQAQEKSPNGTKQMGSDTKSGADTKGADTKMGSDAKSGSTVGAASSGSVNLTTQQRTVVRERVLTSSAPRVTSVNFSINVGTVVPSTVRVVEVPATIVEIRPEWRGYRYFVYNDEIIIVEPRTLKIVAVWNV